jgi:hypothetical protein
MPFFESWAGLSIWLKIGISLTLLLISTVAWFGGHFWPWGWVTGGILLMFSFPNDAQKRGYHDF